MRSTELAGYSHWLCGLGVVRAFQYSVFQRILTSITGWRAQNAQSLHSCEFVIFSESGVLAD